jgi:hypothetical protein
MDIFNKKHPLPPLTKRGKTKWHPPLAKRGQGVLSDIYPLKSEIIVYCPIAITLYFTW